MPVQFITNIFIAFLWVFFQDEEQFEITTFVSGYLVGLAILYLMQRFFPKGFYLRRVVAAIKLIVIFILELSKSAYQVLVQILSPTIKIKPGIFKYNTKLRGEWEVPLLALLLTLTPGSVVVEVTPEGDAFYIHGIDVYESKATLLKSLDRFEKAIMEVTR